MTRAPEDEALLDASVRIDHLPVEGRDVDVVATEAQRAAIAERLRISAVDRLEAHLHVGRLRGGLRIEGEVKAVTVQPCVVSFVPVMQQIEEPIDRVFMPIGEQIKGGAAHPEIFVDLEADDEPDYFDGPEADLSEAIIEAIALALDPYPRAPDAVVPDEAIDPDGGESPFAALGSLLNRDNKG